MQNNRTQQFLSTKHNSSEKSDQKIVTHSYPLDAGKEEKISPIFGMDESGNSRRKMISFLRSFKFRVFAPLIASLIYYFSFMGDVPSQDMRLMKVWLGFSPDESVEKKIVVDRSRT